MMNKAVLACAVLFTLCGGVSHAATFGSGSRYDSRIQTVTYNQDDVVNIRIKKGSVSVVQVGSDETIKDIGLGDPEAWKVSVRDHSVFFRPVVDDNPDTNVTIVTDKRTYPLYLVSVTRDPTYLLRFNYPSPPHTVFKPTKHYPCMDGGIINGHYQLKGDRSVFPYQVWDDGTFTCMRWTSRQEMPVLYRVDADGKEHLVDNHADKNTMVYHEVSENMRLRLGDQVVDVHTSSVVNKGWNASGTTTGQVRKDKFNYEQ